MVLSGTKKEKKYNVTGIKLSEDITRRLQVLGLTKGTEIKILNKSISGNVIFSVRGARYALGKAYADGISVIEKSELKDFSAGINKEGAEIK